MLRFLLATVMVAALTGCLAAGSKPQFGNQPTQSALVLPIPDRYCELSAVHPMDREMLEITAQINASHNYVLSIFADCEQLVAWRAEGSDFEQYGMYLSPLTSHGRRYSMTRSDFVGQVAKEFGQFDQMDTVGEEMKKRVKEAEVSINLHEMVHLGLLHADDWAAYTGVLQRVSDDSGYEANVAVVTGMTLLQGQVVTLNLSAPYEGQKTVQALLRQQQRNVRELVDANRG